jgi:hypothetical protein
LALNRLTTVLIALLGALILIGGFAWKYGPEALLAGGAFLLAFGLLVDPDRKR